MRMRLRAPGHEGRPGDELYTLLPDEVPLRLAVSVFVCGGGGRGGLSGCVGCAVWWRCCCCCGFPPTAPTHPHLQDLGNERAAADADLRERLGTLRYLLGLQEREASKAAAAAAAAAAAEAAEAGAAAPVQEAPQVGAAAADAALAAGVEPEAMEVDRASTAAGEAGEDDMCPICHEELGAELVRRRAGGGGAAGADEARGGLGKPHTPPLAPPSGHAGLRAPPLLPLQHGPGGASATQPGAGKRTHERAIGGGGGGAPRSLQLLLMLPTPQAHTPPTPPRPRAQAHRRVQCPTCRLRTPVADIAYIDARGGAARQGGTATQVSWGGAAAAAAVGAAAAAVLGPLPPLPLPLPRGSRQMSPPAQADKAVGGIEGAEAGVFAGEEAIEVKGSYSTKVSGGGEGWGGGRSSFVSSQRARPGWLRHTPGESARACVRPR